MSSSNRIALLVMSGVLVAVGATYFAFGSATEKAGATNEMVFSDIDKHMDAIDGAVRKLKTKLEDANLDVAACSTLALDIQEHIVASKRTVPPKTAKLGEEEKMKGYAGYRKMLNDLLAHAVELENAILDGNAQAAKEAHGKMISMKKPAHDKYK